MKIYLAGPSSELQRVLKYASELDRRGVEITCRWWEALPQQCMTRDGELTREQQTKHACADLRGIDAADAFWALWPEGSSSGVQVELGYAISGAYWAKSKIIVTGTRAHECIFTSLADYRDASDDCGIIEVIRLARFHRKTESSA